MAPCVPDRSERTAEIYGGFAFAFVVLAGFAQLAFLSSRLHTEPWKLVATFVGGGVYLVLGVFSGQWTDGVQSRRTLLYFAVQTAIVTTIVLLTPAPGFFGVVALPLAAQAMFDLRWPLALSLNAWLYGVCVATYWIPWGPRAGLQAAMSFSTAFLFTATFSFLTARAFRLREQAETLSRELSEANERLRAQSAQAEELATVRERNRLAREIHDGLGHYLTVINVQLEAGRTLLEREPARAADALAKATRLSREALEEVRCSVANLHAATPHAPLAPRLEALCAEAEMPVHYRVEGTPRPLSSAAEHALYRAAQEGLTNVRKHAGASRADVSLDYRPAGRVTLRVVDNGSNGAQSSSPPNGAGFGLRGMRERIDLLGGCVTAAPGPQRGFELRVEVPG